MHHHYVTTLKQFFLKHFLFTLKHFYYEENFYSYCCGYAGTRSTSRNFDRM